MKNLRRTFTVLFAAAFSMQMLAQREDKLINQDWSFRFSHQVNANAARRVDLPHTGMHRTLWVVSTITRGE